MEEKTGRPYEEIQLDFAFVTARSDVPIAIAEESHSGRAPRAARTRSLEKVMATAQSALLEASLDEINEHLLPLFEFCEAALTRALDLSPLRKGELFSPEEYRSLRGIGQAQWLLNEAAAKRESKTASGHAPKRKRSQKLVDSSRNTDI